jgi:WD40 repeat protein
MKFRTFDKAPTIALWASGVLVCVWLIFVAQRNTPIDHRISNVALSRTGRWIAAGNSQGLITLSEGRSGSALWQASFARGPLNDLQFSPDERLLAVAGTDLGLYSVQHPAEPRFIRSDGRNYGTVRFSSDATAILVVTGAGMIEVLEGQSGAMRFHICCSSVYGEVAFTPDERSIVNAGHWPRRWDVFSGRLLAPLTKDRELPAFGPIASDPALDAICMGSEDGRVYCWNLTSRRLIAISPAQSEYVNTIAVLSTGWVAYASFGGIVRLWNPQNGQERPMPAALPSSNLVPGPDGASIMFGTSDGEIQYWDAREARRLRATRIP